MHWHRKGHLSSTLHKYFFHKLYCRDVLRIPSPYSRIHRLRKGEKCGLTDFFNRRIFESRRPHSIQAGILFGEFLFRPMVSLNINLDHWKLHMSSNPHLNLASKQQNASINRAAFKIMRTLVFECQHDNKYTNKASDDTQIKRLMRGRKIAFVTVERSVGQMNVPSFQTKALMVLPGAGTIRRNCKARMFRKSWVVFLQRNVAIWSSFN